MGVLVAHGDETVAMLPKKMVPGSPQKLCFFSSPELKRWPNFAIK